MLKLWSGGGRPAVTVVPPRRVILYASSMALTAPASSKAKSTPPLVAARICSITPSLLALNVSVAPSSLATWSLLLVRQIFPPDLDAFVLLSSHKSAICRDPSRVMLLSTLPPVWEGHLQGLENLGLLRIGAGQARHAVGLIQGVGQQTEKIEGGHGGRNRDPMRRVLRGAKCSRQAPLQLSAAFQCEQTHEDMTAGPPFLTDEDRAHFQQPGLHRAEVIFDVRQVLIARVGRVRIEQGRGHVGLEDITAC